MKKPLLAPTMDRPFFVEGRKGKPVVRMWVRDVPPTVEDFYFAPAGDFSSEEHAQSFADRLNDRLKRG